VTGPVGHNQVVSWGDAGQVRESVPGVPAPALLPFVGWYIGYRQAGFAPGQHRGLPSPDLTMIITLDEPIQLAVHPDPRRPPSTYRTLLGGLHSSPAIIRHQGSQSGVQIGLKPLGARVLLGLPAGELAHLDTDAACVLGPVAAELHERIREAPTWPRRFAVVDEVLLRQFHGDQEVSREVARAWRVLLATGGAVPVSELARAAGWSSRQLGARFRTEIGLTPKEAGRVVRFDRARRLLQRRVTACRPTDLADLAAGCGYYDQAHLAREFRALAGVPPSRWVAEEFRNVQVPPLVPEAE
jgi:AraC-like DNA-binding protein